MASEALRLRLARAEDCELLYRWANDPLTRRMSTSSREIAWPQHIEWFRQKLQDPDVSLYIVTHREGTAVGQVRFDCDSGGSAIVSVSIAPDWRGRGYAAQAIRLATATVRESATALVIHAFIKPDNLASVRAFSRAGYSDAVQVEHRGFDMLRMSVM